MLAVDAFDVAVVDEAVEVVVVTASALGASLWPLLAGIGES